MKEYIMNEREYAEHISSGGNFKESALTAVKTLGKYYKSLCYTTQQIRAELDGFINAHAPHTAQKIKEKVIKQAIDIANKSPLYEIDKLIVTKPEIDTIYSLHSTAVKDYRLRRLAFTLLCFSKYFALRGTRDGWINAKWSDIFSAAHLPNLTKERQKVLIREIYASGLIYVPPFSSRECVQVLFAQDGEPAITVDNINEAGFVYEEHNDGKRFIKCQRCGCRVPVTNGRAKLCKPCGVIVDRDKARERARLKRNKQSAAKAT